MKRTQTSEHTHLIHDTPSEHSCLLKQMVHIRVAIRGKQPGVRPPSYLNSCVPTATVCFMSRCTQLPFGADPAPHCRAHLMGIIWTHLSAQFAWSKTKYTFLNRKLTMGNLGLVFPVFSDESLLL